jgi:sigma-B regulation protein RsbU (phosphoserine phosphatase)
MGSDNISILIVDDDITIRKIIGHHLKANKYKAYEAPGAREAFAILEEVKIDLVLCDVTMEEMDGFTFCHKVRENEKYRAVPFIFVTAKTSQEDKNRALEAGGDDIITKPFDIRDLLIKVQALLRRSDIYKIYGAKKNFEESLQQTAVSRIVLVDDDASMARLFQYNLNKSGFDCVIASGAEEGLMLIKANPPDIIISDIMMPLIDGFEFRRMLMSDDQLKHIPFIFLTSKGEEKDILEGYDMGIADYVVKTSGPRIIIAKVKAILKSLGKERQKVVSELHSAANSMRVKVVPESPATFKGYEIKQWHVPYQGIPGGDFIDYFELDEKNIAVILGDVMGKKWGAWYFAFAYAGYVRSALRIVLQTAKEYNTSEILQQVNSSVYQDAKISEVFATLSILILNNETKTVKYSGAGDLPIFYKSADSNEVKRIQSAGKLLGFAAEGNYDEVTIDFKQNDQLYLITDGILESRNSAGEQFGVNGLDNLINSISYTDDAILKIQTEFRAFTGNQFEDDISLITLKADYDNNREII